MFATLHMNELPGRRLAQCALLACAAFSSGAWAQAGYIHQVSGLVSIEKEAGKVVQAKAGDTFDANTAYRSGADGKVTLKFADGQVVSLGPDSAVRVAQYRYDPANPRQSSSTIEVQQGDVRLVAGLIGTANSSGVRVMAGSSLVSPAPGGADFTVGVKPGAQDAGYVVVARGEVSASTPGGQIGRIVAGQYAPWQPDRAASAPIPFSAAPAVVQAAAGASWITLVPSNSPVEVNAAARSAAVAAAPALPAPGDAPALTEGGVRFAGYVVGNSNAVSVRTASGGRANATAGTTFQAGASFSTGAESNLTLKFADGLVVVLGPKSNLAVTEYQYDPSNPKTSKAAIDLVSGTMRLVSGAIQAENRDGMNISAGVSLIDIISEGPADFRVAVDDGKQEREVGIAKVALGEIAVHTPYGPIDKIRKDESAPWGPKTRPEVPVPLAAGLALVESIVTLQTPKVPDSEPVSVLASAQAAAANAEASRAQALANANPTNPQLQAAAKAATELASIATQAATTAAQTISASTFASALTNLPATAAGPELAPIQVASAPQATPLVTTPIVSTVTPGAGGGGCRGSPC